MKIIVYTINIKTRNAVTYYLPLAYHERTELFLTESEARAFFDTLDGIEDKKVHQVLDIWGWGKRHSKGA